MSMDKDLLCPRCGKLTCEDLGFPRPHCPFCEYSDLIDIGEQNIKRYAENNDSIGFLKVSNSICERHLDKTNPVFDQELFDKRVKDDERLLQNAIERDRQRQEYERKKAEEEASYIPRCPTCGSPHVCRTDEWESIYRKLQFECLKCGYKW